MKNFNSLLAALAIAICTPQKLIDFHNNQVKTALIS